MGDLHYGAARARIHMDDRTLAHVSAVTTAKLRRSEPFLLSWVDTGEADEGRSAVWIHQACDLRFVYSSNEPQELDRELLERMSRLAASVHGLRLGEEAELVVAE